MSTSTRRFSFTAAADDLAVVVLGYRELEDDGAVVLLELLDRDLIGLVDQLASQRFEKVTHRPRLPRGGVDALGLQQLADRVGGLGALGEPGADLVLVDFDRRR